MHPTLNIAVKAARRAGNIINRASTDLAHIKVHAKSANDFVTEVDKKAEAAIIDVLREAYPEYGILAEESGQTAGQADGSRQGRGASHRQRGCGGRQATHGAEERE